MSFGTKYNTRSPAVKRLMREAVELHEPTDQYCAQPLEDNLFEWHFTVRGAPDTEFGGGVYHGRILLPPEYPMKPPSIMLLTPNGRFETGKKICLSMSAHHPETWQPSWSIRTVLLAIIGFMPTKGEGAIGALDYSSQERKILAARSLEWICDVCGSMNALSLREGFEASDVINQEAKELAAQISFKGEKEDEALVKKNVKLHGKIESLKESTSDNLQNSSNTAKIIPNSVEGEIKDNSIGKGKEEKEITHIDAEYRGKERSNNFGNIENRAVDDEDSNVIRKRNTVQKDSKTSDVNSAENDQNLGPNQGTISLVLLWLVVIGLVVLILRRLCMDTISIGKA